VIGLFAGVLAAAENVTLEGEVIVYYADDDAAEVEQIILDVDGVEYEVVLDAKGLELAELDGHKVRAEGQLKTEDGVELLTVKTYRDLGAAADGNEDAEDDEEYAF
jgi:hypothetical protein